MHAPDFEACVMVTIAAAGAATIALPFAIGPISTVSLRSWAGAAMRSMMLGVGATSAVIGVGAAVVVPVPEIALAAAIAGAVAFYLVLVARYRLLRRTVREFPGLRDRARRAETWARLSALLDRHRPETHTSRVTAGVWNSAVQRVAATLIDIGDFELAAETLTKLHGVEPGPIGSATVTVMHALVQVHRGSVTKAAAALDALKPVPVPLTGSMADATRALVHAVAGRPDAALEILDAWKHPDTWHVRTRIEARAHALAARSDEAGARTTLLELERKYGQAGLACVEMARGPASELARELSAQSGDPYR